MAFSVPEKKAVLVAFDLAALAACVAAAFELVAKVPALSALEVSSQAFWSKIFGLLLLFVAYLNYCMDITRLRSAWRYLRRWWAACAVTAVIYLFVFFLFGRSPASGGGGAAIPRVVPIPTLALAAFVVPIARLTVERWLELSSRRKNCIVLGAGRSGQDFVSKAETSSTDWNVCAVVDDDPSKQGFHLGRARVAGTWADLPQLVDKHQVEEVIHAKRMR